MKKIGILTYHYVINEGAMLQAYALQQILKDLFQNCVVEIVNYESLREKRGDFLSCFRNPQNIKVVAKKLSHYYKLNKFKKEYFNLSKPRYLGDSYLRAIKFLNKKKYDLIIVGSDEVWKNIPPNIYWLGPEILSQKVSYAASAHKALYNELSEKEKNFVIGALKEFKLIGVRDEYTFNMVESFLEKESKNKLFKVLDPTFLYDFSRENIDIEKILLKNKIDLDYPIAIFALENEKISQMARKFLKEKNYQIISIGCYNKYADFNLFDKLNPLEWAAIFRKGNFCVTDRFHATIFSLKNKVPFIAVNYLMIYKKIKSKIRQLLEDFGLTQHVIDLVNERYNYNKVENKMALILKSSYQIEEILNKKREESLIFLENIRKLL